MKINNVYEIGEKVYLQTDIDQRERIVTGFNVRKETITYALSCGTEDTWHYDFEISTDKKYNL